MKNRSGQVSVEFMLLIALVLIIFIPVFILISRAGLDTSDQVSGERIGALARTILDDARETYYLGEGSRQRITLEFPTQLNSIYVVNTSTTWEIAINFTQSGQTSQISAVSEVPIRIASSNRIACGSTLSCVDCDCAALNLSEIGVGAQDIELRTVNDDGLVVEIGYR